MSDKIIIVKKGRMEFRARTFYGLIFTTRKNLAKAKIIGKEFMIERVKLKPMKDKELILNERYYKDWNVLSTQTIIGGETFNDRLEIIEQIICDQEFTDEDYMKRKEK